MAPSVAARAPLAEPRRLRQWSGAAAGGWLRITLVSFLATLPVEQLRAFPSSLSDCQTPTGWNCSGFDDRDTDLFLCDTNTCKFDGECLRIGNMVTCICDFKMINGRADAVMLRQRDICLSAVSFQRYVQAHLKMYECCTTTVLKRIVTLRCMREATELTVCAAMCCCCRRRRSHSVGEDEVTFLCSWRGQVPAARFSPRKTDGFSTLLVVSVLSPPRAVATMPRKVVQLQLTDAGSGSGDDGGEGSAEAGQKETSTCDICQFGAECDVDAEDVWCVCNIDCSHISFNPVCASDGRSYDNPCQVKEASCQKQERIEVKYLGHCQGDIITGNKGGDGHFARTDLTEKNEDPRNGLARGLYIPCPDHYKNYCVHGECQFPSILAQPSCRKCPRTNRINRQKQNNVHFSSENTMRASTRLI
ncbi:hypothetical protein F2P81_020862 [Scophthalmus maximus]|uniref:Kazal-like domain-containing protein n=1 Tax=Scophthalmus maximus TaxID=52904 RepID=A0A6A4S1I4_SCOMX|nr:hypothetical protein F2P81_020862 [Scophthalmus maximus]